MQWKPHVTVAAIIRRDERFLLVEEEIGGRRVFYQPAGHLEEHESLSGAVAREVLEETGRRFSPAFLTGVYLYPNRRDDVTYLRFCFYGDCGERDERLQLDDGIVDTHWLSLEEIEENASRLRSPLVIASLRDYLAGRAYPLDLLQHFPPGAAGS